ncbi:MAG: hypothetical protein NC338_07845 [Firmicutes bacterium]|nr:hypothetical protein [Bacillota bacterium]MCM1401717.1 hypothetical protein [Bacteroides sp.]MCM1477746.1 hypothetical protein [Bacteroides sp.]
MAEENYEDTVAYLYDCILNRLNNGESLADIDLDSLVEVYDYAYDLSDEFVCSEVMSSVLNSDADYLPMRERKAVRFLQMSEYEGAKAMAKLLPAGSFIRRLVKAQLSWDSTNWKEEYESLFSGLKKGAIDDFGAVTLIDMAMAVDDLRHLSQLLPSILPLLKYHDEFLSDLANTLYDNQHYSESVAVYQTLTDNEPFNIDNWIKIADIYINHLKMYDDGLGALDYALAIDPQNSSAQLLMGDLLLKSGKDFDKIHEITDNLLGRNERKLEALYLKAAAYIEQKETAKAVECLVQYTDECVNPIDIFVLIISLLEGKLSDDQHAKLIGFIKNTDTTELTACVDRARTALDGHCFGVLLEHIARSGVTLSEDMLGTMLMHHYRMKRYSTVIEIYESLFGTEPEASTGLIYIFSKLRCDKTFNPRDFLETHMERSVSIATNSNNLGLLIVHSSIAISKKLYMLSMDSEDYSDSEWNNALDQIDIYN